MITQKEESQLRADLEAMTWLAAILLKMLYDAKVTPGELGSTMAVYRRMGRPTDTWVRIAKDFASQVIDPTQRG